VVRETKGCLREPSDQGIKSPKARVTLDSVLDRKALASGLVVDGGPGPQVGVRLR